MKANLLSRPILLTGLIATMALASSCSERRVEPSPVPAPAPAPSPTPPPAPMPRLDWRQAPLTPGDWRWRMEGSQSVARFGSGLFILSCNRAAGTITMFRSGQARGSVPVTIITAAQTRQLSGDARAAPSAGVEVIFSARDPLLDAMAFSRGRFAVDFAGMSSLIIPSWPEVSKVIEDCR